MAVSGVDPAALVFALDLQNPASPAGVIEETNREVLVETGAFLRDANQISLVVTVHVVAAGPFTGSPGTLLARGALDGGSILSPVQSGRSPGVL